MATSTTNSNNSQHQLSPTKAWLVVSNFVVAASWARVFFLLAWHRTELLSTNSATPEEAEPTTNTACLDSVVPAVQLALMLSFVELGNALIGLTRSKPAQVLLFSSVRMGVCQIAAPKLPCNAWQTLLTIACWSFGDVIRFGCFGVDTLVPGGRWAKNVRYTVAPIVFPLGALGEMLMVIRIASEGRPKAYLAAALWPVGFYPLIVQLLKQRKKHFAAQSTSNQKIIKSV